MDSFMLITRAYKIRLYPTKAQKVFFNKTFGCCRVIWNEMLYKIEEAYSEGIKLNKCDLFKKIRDKYEWMKEADSQGLCQTFIDLEKTYYRFYDHISNKPKIKEKVLKIHIEHA